MARIRGGQDYGAETYQTERPIVDEEEMMRRIREGSQDMIQDDVRRTRNNLDYDEDVIRSQQQDVVPEYQIRSQDEESWGVGGPPDQGDVIPEKYKSRRSMESEEDLMRR